MAKASELVRQHVQQVRAIPSIVAQRSAPRIEQKLIADATTRRGNVPSYGRRGDVPIAVEVRADEIHVHGPDWVLRKAQSKAQVDGWKDIVADEAAKLIERGIGR